MAILTADMKIIDFKEEFQLDLRIQNALAQRLAGNPDYTIAEIEHVGRLSKKLFPEGLDTDEKTNERLRALATTSMFEIRPARTITSHRKFLGPLIVLMKKISYPFIKIHLQESFAGQQEFNSLMLDTVAGVMRDRSKTQ